MIKEHIRPLVCILAGLILAGSWPSDSQAYPTRLHIYLGNRLHAELEASGDRTAPLLGSDYRVRLSEQDARAILDHLPEFRAGTISPDITNFPVILTDGSHAWGQRPYEQCDLLYADAVTDAERAYALGCMHHGAADAVIHHYVNYLAGETFTMAPIHDGRQSSYYNVVRHLVSELMVQDATYEVDPDAFTAAELAHTIPKDFVIRTYYNRNSQVWQLAAAKAVAHLEAARQAYPGLWLHEVLEHAELENYMYILLIPVFLDEWDLLQVDARTFIEDQIATFQDPNSPDGAELLVSAGDDGILGTEDDETDCSVTCPVLYAKYFLYTGLLRPRYDAGGNELPSAFALITDKLDTDLREFPWEIMNTIEAISQRINTPLGGGEDFDISPAELDALFGPMENWVVRLTTIDYGLVAQEVAPQWLLDLERLLQAAGVDVDLAGLISALIDPYLEPVREAIRTQVKEMAKQELQAFIEEYAAVMDETRVEFGARLDAAGPQGLGGSVLDHYLDSGLFQASVNITTAAMANRDLLLPVGGNPDGGPVSFDTSYSLEWMQAGVCGYLRECIFPMGVSMQAMLSVQIGDQLYPSQLADDAPLECHDGSLWAFADAPTRQVCLPIDLLTLIEAVYPVGSLSRGYPPALGSAPACAGLFVDGLPECGGRACGPDGLGGECGPGCALDEECEPITGQCIPLCLEGATRCDGDRAEQCSGGDWMLREDCAVSGFACEQGDCVGGCTDGALRCNGNLVETCSGGAYSVTADCAASGERCEFGQCVGGATCTEGVARCYGDWVEVCEGGAWWFQEDCTYLNETCEQGVCVGGCTDGALRCNGDWVEVCTGGFYEASQDCAASNQTCEQGACIGGCSPGAVRCNGDWVERCLGGTFNQVQDCAAAGWTCEAGACVSACTNGAARCDGDLAQSCQDGAWQTDQDCATSGQTCVDGVCVGSGCTDGAVRCDGDLVQECTGGVFQVVEDCADDGLTCEDGGCVAVCTEGASRCSGEVAEVCVGGAWQLSQDCGAAGQTCDPARGQCKGGGGGGCASAGQAPFGGWSLLALGVLGLALVARRWRAFAAWGPAVILVLVAPLMLTGCPSDGCEPACEDRACGDDGCGGTCAPGCAPSQSCSAAGQCVSGCDDGQERCDGDTVEQCVGGDWQAGVDCSLSGQVCQDGECVGAGCTDGTSRCAGDLVQTCADGAWQDGEDCAASGQTCDAGECVGAGCTDGQTRCDGDVVETCTADVWQLGEDCAQTNRLCQFGACIGGCSDGATRCLGSVIQTCVDNTWQNGVDCGATNQSCQAGACVGGCAQGETRCDGDQVEECIGGEWWFLADCAERGTTCELGACTGACIEDALQCNGDWVQICQAGAWQDEEDCDTDGRICELGQCRGTDCVDGSQRCSGTVRERCEGGLWQAQEDCDQAGQLCLDGQCKDPDCAPDETSCDGEVVLDCVNGLWQAGQDCADLGQTCTAAGCAGNCTDGETRCNTDIVEACIAGMWTLTQDDCFLMNMQCVDGACVDIPPLDLLIEALGTSVWHGQPIRDGVQRAFELHFDVFEGLLVEVRNPFGPSRFRKMHYLTLDPDGLHAQATVTRPNGWENPPDHGQAYPLTIQVFDEDPRRLVLTREGQTEEYTEGAWPEPIDGLTAIAMKFPSGGLVDEAFCNASSWCSFDYETFLGFIHGQGPEEPVWTDVVAGAPLLEWRDDTGQNRFGITDVPGFDMNGGTVYSDQFNFFVRYQGWIDHPGGDLWMREADDDVEDGIWAFTGDQIGSTDINDVFLEVHGWWGCPEETRDEVDEWWPAGPVPVEIILVRCTEQLVPVTVQMRIGDGDWMQVGDVPSSPLIDGDLFPPLD